MGDERLKMNTGVIIHFSLAVSEVVGDGLKLGLGESLLVVCFFTVENFIRPIYVNIYVYIQHAVSIFLEK